MVSEPRATIYFQFPPPFVVVPISVLFLLQNIMQVCQIFVFFPGHPEGDSLIWAIKVCAAPKGMFLFSAVLVINRASTLAILVTNRVSGHK